MRIDVDKKFKEPDAIGLLYHSLTEEYDETVCSILRKGIAIPLNGEEAAKCCKNARLVTRRIKRVFNVQDNYIRDCSRRVEGNFTRWWRRGDRFFSPMYDHYVDLYAPRLKKGSEDLSCVE